MTFINSRGAFLKSDVAKNPGSKVAVGGSDVQLVAANGDRVEVTVVNDHATQIVYLKLGAAAVLNEGIRLNAAGGSYTTSAFTGEIRAIATGAGTNVTVAEV